MRRWIIIVLCLAILVSNDACTGSGASSTVTLSGAFALYPLAISWKEEYSKVKPDVKIEVAAGGAGKGMTDVLGGLVDVAMVSREVNRSESDKGAFPLTVAKDAVVPTINASNPLAGRLRERGLTRKECAAVWITGTARRWRDLRGLPGDRLIRVYTRSDACGAGEVWSKYLGGLSQDDLGGVQVFGDPGLADAVVKDVDGLGYNNIGFAYDPSTLKPVTGLEILKIDFNGNGRIDPEEDVYATRDDLTRAIRDGRFPSPPARELYFVTRGKPGKPAVVAFLTWVLTEGQRFVEAGGYVTVPEEDINRCLGALR
ncbi:MAG: substrate-binding domain-containing protein [Spirochaetales bacterium]|nr:substrate-binding domain-containing protein [Spirochaetales bacterium]